jgi:hypothetical protein
MRQRLAFCVATLAIACGWFLALSPSVSRAADASGKLTEDEAAKIAADAYVFGFPLVLMDVTRQARTAVPKADEGRAPANQFTHSAKFPDPKFRAVVSPNADTLYSSAWLKLAKEPLILSLPDAGKRYYLMQLMDAWTNTFACPGTRTTGNGKGDFAIVGPNWKGELPAGVQELRSPTNMVWLLGRTQTNGADDYDAVHAVQRQYKLTPLSAWGKAFTLPDDVPVEAGVDTKTPPLEQVMKMDAATFYGRLNALMKDNPPAAADESVIKKLAAVGIAPGKMIDWNTLDPAVAAGLKKGVTLAHERLAAATKLRRAGPNGWEVNRNTGTYGTNYPLRALVSYFALGANLPEDALYPRARVDSEGRPLKGSNRYVLHFPKGQLPPAQAFWSVTMYNSNQAFVENSIGRYAIGDRDRLHFNDDGSLTLYVQRDSPGRDKESNWLPAPADDFNMIMRIYWPKKEALEGSWKPPAVQRVNGQ